MSDNTSKVPPAASVDLGPLEQDVIFMTRNLQTLLRPKGEALREALGLEAGMIGVLSVVWLNPGVSQNDLAASLVLKKSAVTKLVTTMEQQGLVARRRVSEDRRMNALSLTADGHQMIAKVRRFTEELQDALFDGIDAEKRSTFFEVMAALLDRLDDDHPA